MTPNNRSCLGYLIFNVSFCIAILGIILKKYYIIFYIKKYNIHPGDGRDGFSFPKYLILSKIYIVAIPRVRIQEK
jgi:hypothetical protein